MAAPQSIGGVSVITHPQCQPNHWETLKFPVKTLVTFVAHVESQSLNKSGPEGDDAQNQLQRQSESLAQWVEEVSGNTRALSSQSPKRSRRGLSRVLRLVRTLAFVRSGDAWH